MKIKDKIKRKIKAILNGKIKACAENEYEYKKVFDAHKFVFPEYKSLLGKVDFEKYESDVAEAGVYTIKNGIFSFGFEEVYTSKKNVLEKITSLKQNPKIGTIKNLKVQKVINGTVATLFLSGLEKNYYHFTVECLLRYWILKNSGINIDFLAVYTGENENSFQLQLLKIIGGGELVNKILHFPKGTVIKAKKLVVPSLVNNWEPIFYRGYESYKKMWLPLWAKDLYAFIVEKNSKNQNCKTCPYIYIERKKAERRKIINSNELFEILQKYGFEKVNLEDLSVSEQISLFNNAKIIVSPHGAGLANLSYCKKNTKVLELYSQFYHDPGFRIHATALGLNYNYLICKTPNTQNIPAVEEDILVENFPQIETWLKGNI